MRATTLNEDMKLYLKEVARKQVLTRDEEVDLFKRLSNGDPSARHEIVEANLRFVIKIALQFTGRGVPLPDLIQEGNIGLLEVVDKFDYKKGFRFSTYAAFWIRQAIQMAVRKNGNVIRLPIRKSRFMGHLNESISNFTASNGRMPTVDELSGLLDVEPEKLEQLMSMRESILSLDMEMEEDGGQLMNRLPDTSSPSALEYSMENEQHRKVQKALSTLSEKEQKVLKLRYGFDSGKGLSLRSTSKLVGMSQEGVRRVERTAIRKLRRPASTQMVSGLL
jgi:RNA polymerase primary sigma factor